MTQEIWREIPGYPEKFQVSNTKKVRTLYCYIGKQPKELKQHLTDGYPRVNLCYDGKGHPVMVHKLVGLAFQDICGEWFPGAQINHLNEDKTDNSPENLRWVTPKENVNWGTRSQRVSEMFSIPVYQYTVSGDFVRRWDGAKAVEDETGWYNTNIIACCNGRQKTAYGFIWSHQPLISNPSTGSASTRSSINASRNLSS